MMTDRKEDRQEELEGRGLVIAIDGPGGVGKTTVSRLLAAKLNLRYVNTGFMYRALALAADSSGVDLKSEAELEAFCNGLDCEYDSASGGVTINGKDYSEEVRSPKAGELASIASAAQPVREFMVAFQRGLAAPGSVVMEGRDIGTVVCPEADLKFFLDAPHEVRAKRRHLEDTSGATSEEVSRNIGERDKRDRARVASPLKPAPDAVHIDTGLLDVEGVVKRLLSIVSKRAGA